jgi:NAD(P)-dependent dehydrogenase (short-subunit alcohol dehydrogenase family)
MLEGKVAIVTGASSGIGEATARLLAERGASVLGIARDEERLRKLNMETGVETMASSLADAGASEAAVARARRLGRPTILVHCAGRGGSFDRPIFEQTWEDWRATMAINLDAAFALARAVASDIRAEGWGRIVMVSSTAGEVGAPAMSAYCASKHGVIGLMRSLAHDLAPCGGTANAVLPGWVRTRMAERDAAQEAERRGLSVDAVWAERADANPAKRLLTPKEVANTIGFLASAEASGINGQAITVSLGSVW